MKGINEWAKDLKHDEKIAKQFAGVKSVADIIDVAKENGYEFTAGELIDFDLDSVSGGSGSGKGGTGNINTDVVTDIVVTVKDATNNAINLGENSTVQSNPTISIG